MIRLIGVLFSAHPLTYSFVVAFGIRILPLGGDLLLSVNRCPAPIAATSFHGGECGVVGFNLCREVPFTANDTFVALHQSISKFRNFLLRPFACRGFGFHGCDKHRANWVCCLYVALELRGFGLVCFHISSNPSICLALLG